MVSELSRMLKRAVTVASMMGIMGACISGYHTVPALVEAAPQARAARLGEGNAPAPLLSSGGAPAQIAVTDEDSAAGEYKGSKDAQTSDSAQRAPMVGPETGYAIKGTCTTGFADSSSNRMTNIAVASSKFDRLILNPGQEVSANVTFTPRTSQNGYKSAGVYSGGKTVQGIGGGICQVSSTIYNAAMNAGLTVTERHPHSMRVSYLPAGMDAAISSGSKDLRIRNDYPFPVMFETYIVGTDLTVNVYTDERYTAGISYRLHSVSTGRLSADTYLEKTVNGQVVEDKFIGKSSYQPHG